MSENNGGDLSARKAEEILVRLKKIAEENLEMKPERVAEIGLDTPIVEGLELDSLAQVTLITTVENDFGIVFEPEDREQMRTVRDLVHLIHSRSESRVP